MNAAEESRITAGARYLNARSELLEMTIAERRRDLVPRADASQLFGWIASEAVADLPENRSISGQDLRARLRVAVEAAEKHLAEG